MQDDMYVIFADQGTELINLVNEKERNLMFSKHQL